MAREMWGAGGGERRGGAVMFTTFLGSLLKLVGSHEDAKLASMSNSTGPPIPKHNIQGLLDNCMCRLA